MFKRIDIIASYGLVAAGMIHTALTPVAKSAGGEEALWFAGTGIALGALGLLNIARHEAPNTRVRQLSAAANLASIPYMLVVTWMLPAPHVMLVLAMLLAATFYSLYTPLQQPGVG